LPPVEEWLSARGWRPFDFQREVWQAVAQGRSGMLHATTGSGKTSDPIRDPRWRAKVDCGSSPQ